MPYIFMQKQIRNDNHCPTCRLEFIAVYANREEGEQDQDVVAFGCTEWVDEWVRRRNGDMYHFFKLAPDVVYDLHEYDLGGDKNVRTKTDTKSSDTANKEQYLLLQITVRKEEWCPDNITFKVSFHTTFATAFHFAKANLELTGEDLGLLHKTNTLCSHQSEQEHDHYQIIPLRDAERVCLNNFCEFISEEMWHKK
jgi:hypothetical protein